MEMSRAKEDAARGGRASHEAMEIRRLDDRVGNRSTPRRLVRGLRLLLLLRSLSLSLEKRLVFSSRVFLPPRAFLSRTFISPFRDAWHRARGIFLDSQRESTATRPSDA